MCLLPVGAELAGNLILMKKCCESKKMLCIFCSSKSKAFAWNSAFPEKNMPHFSIPKTAAFIQRKPCTLVQGSNQAAVFVMQERKIENLEQMVRCNVPPAETEELQNIKPCGRKYSGMLVNCSKSTALECSAYLIQLANERQKYRGIED